MKFLIKNSSGGNIINLARKIGYFLIGEAEDKSEYSFIMPMERSGYPRFHLYLKPQNNSEIIFNLHLDQKKPVYKNSTAHSGEYDSPLVLQEAERIKQILK